MTHHRLTAIAWTIVVVALPACDTSTTSVAPAESSVADTMAADQAIFDPTVLDVTDETSINTGDVEQALRIIGVLSDRSKSENIVENHIVDGREKVRGVNIEVNPPNPGSLWISVRVDCSREFAERPIILDTKVLVDGKLLDSFTIVLSKLAHKNIFQRDVEVLFGLDEIPETMLVSMESEALLLPENTDLAVVDPYSVTEGQRTKAIAYTPVRIDFTAPGPKPSNDSAGAETANPSKTPDTDNS